jgi:hypothetical protein
MVVNYYEFNILLTICLRFNLKYFHILGKFVLTHPITWIKVSSLSYKKSLIELFYGSLS